MPIGDPNYVTTIGRHLRSHRLKIRRVLDYGVGMGLYGALVRQWIDEGIVGGMKLDVGNPCTLHGIEIFENYDNPLWDYYETVERQLTVHHKNYDVIFFMDVLEHFVRQEGEALIKELISRLNEGGYLWVGTPLYWNPQGACYGNIHETHRTLWTPRELINIGFEVQVIGSGILGYYRKK